MVTKQPSETASFTFNGTSIEIFGAKRGNHGFYQVNVDSTLYPTGNGHADDPGLFQTSLFAATNLSQGLHHVTVSNQGSTYFDIDFVSIVVWMS